MIHCKILDNIASDLAEITGYDKSLLFESNRGKRCADMKTWLVTICYHKKFSFKEISEYLHRSRSSIEKYKYRHNKRLNDKDYRLKWQIVQNI
jgi:predicted DNA-binding protein YlxM (UPF0122 family)